MFDTQITEIFKLIDEQLQHLKAPHPLEDVVSNFFSQFYKSFRRDSSIDFSNNSRISSFQVALVLRNMSRIESRNATSTTHMEKE